MYYLKTDTTNHQSLQWRQLSRIVRDSAELSRKFGEKPNDDELEAFREFLIYLPGEELAPLALYIISYGDLQLLKELWSARGPFQVSLKRDPEEGTFTLNGRPFVLLSDAQNLFECLNNAVDFHKLLRLISDMEFRGLIDKTPDGFNLLAMGNSRTARDNCRRRSRFSGELPTLEAGVVSHGELLQALTMGATKPGMAKAYDRILCWATPDMVKQHPGLLKPYAAKHEFVTNGVFYPKAMTISEWSERYQADALEGKVGSLPSKIWLQNECDDEHDIARILLRSMATNDVKYGFEAKPGFVLCHTSLEFLHEFPLNQDMDESNLKTAYEFVDKYLPLDLMYLDSTHGARLDDSEFYQGHNYKQFLWLLGSEPEVVEKVKALLTPSQFQALAMENPIDGGLMAVLNTTFGFDNEGMSLKLDSYCIQTLKDAGFKFCDSTHIHSGAVEPLPRSQGAGRTVVDLDKITSGISDTETGPTWVNPDTKRAYVDLISMGLWPCKSIPEPSSVKDALVQCSRRPGYANSNSDTALSLRGYIIKAGAEACAAEAKTPAQWDYLITTLGADAMKPYVEQMPFNAKGKVFSNELGI